MSSSSIELPDFSPPRIQENDAAGLCYTSAPPASPGSALQPRALVLHSMTSALPDSLGLSKSDVVLAVVPMFHVNAWGLPFAATWWGRNSIPGTASRRLERARLALGREGDVHAGVPTVWLGVLEQLDATGQVRSESADTMTWAARQRRSR